MKEKEIEQTEELDPANAAAPQEQVESATATATTTTEKESETPKKVKATAAAPDNQDESGKQVAAAQTAAEPQKVDAAQQKLKGKTPQDTLRNYLAKLNAIDAEPTVTEDEATQEQDAGAKAEPDDGANELQGINWLDDAKEDIVPVLIIQVCQDLDEGELLDNRPLYREMAGFTSTLNDQSKTIAQRAELSKSLLQRFCRHYNLAEHKTKAVFAKYAIMIGMFLLAMKEFVKTVRKTDPSFPQWSVWATANIDFLSERRRQEYMAVAERTDAHGLSYLGIERLLHLTRATEKMSGDNRVGNFLKRYNIPFDPEDEELQIKDFKFAVDAALAVEKAKEKDVTLDFDKVKTLIQVGGEVDRKMLADFALVAQMGADPNEYVDVLIRNRGKRVDFFEGEDLVEHIYTLATRLAKGVDTLITDANGLKQLQISKIEPLESRIATLRETLSGLPPAGTEDIPPDTVNPLSRLEKGLDKLMGDPKTLKKLAISQIESLESRVASLKAKLTGPPPAATE